MNYIDFQLLSPIQENCTFTYCKRIAKRYLTIRSEHKKWIWTVSNYRVIWYRSKKSTPHVKYVETKLTCCKNGKQKKQTKTKHTCTCTCACAHTHTYTHTKAIQFIYRTGNIQSLWQICTSYFLYELLSRWQQHAKLFWYMKQGNLRV